ncbi:ABC transporter permease [Salisediminibacterium halotolerans]|uniref:Tungstate transport system permease protein n=1 Tax=Salisediminibacterium halotolerans TaxID=517425 RepID=A0A1H9SKM0_9BACI|nr:MULTISPECIES: ABC transporter permease [Salisediminibacterium]RLJ73243.1 tungstate transport system permease protein [Actinophytocola xinjiangensis]RPE86665.1 tungstate transport system permease protein [Salisediminibacterium halotolerans]TWG34040.1 tungstate transport system permease protein [Salisediminibacterium halotolerans]SER85235.1 tungstate transport system permease protein [Salisediminibacterium haloalkalitolerans]GEL08303.1 ABC transporter permease [Salisediminibacterium halotoler
MELILSGLREAVDMLATGDNDIYQITLLTLQVCLLSTVISSVIGIPFGMLLRFRSFRGKNIILLISHAGMGLPPVVAGLWVTMLLWRSGPLGEWGWLFTPNAIVIAQVVVSLPIVVSLSYAAFGKIDDGTKRQLQALGPTNIQLITLYLKQAQFGLWAAVMAGLGRVLAEVGAAMMVGGNLQGQTRILTTSMVMEVSRGNFDVALALSFVLMLISIAVTLVLLRMQRKEVHL